MANHFAMACILRGTVTALPRVCLAQGVRHHFGEEPACMCRCNPAVSILVVTKRLLTQSTTNQRMLAARTGVVPDFRMPIVERPTFRTGHALRLARPVFSLKVPRMQ
jgi:hypothetical protein